MGDPRQDLDEVFRDQWGRLLSLLVAQFRRLDLAEDGLADAFEAAARTWTSGGVPTHRGSAPVDPRVGWTPRDASAGYPRTPEAWLLTVARRRVVDRLRAEAVAARKEPLLVVDEEVRQSVAGFMADPGGLLADERLRLVFLCAHPSLAPESAAALSLRLVLGVPTPDIARLFLVPEATMAARLTRAKRKLAAAGAPFVVPEGEARVARTATVLSVVYLAFTSGYAPASGPDVTRVEIAAEAIRLARVLRELMPGDAGVDALLALMLLQHSRRDARTGEEGRPVLLPDQDRGRWRQDEIGEALALLTPIVEAGVRPPGRSQEFLLQALIASEHAVAPSAPATRWDRIASHYAELEDLTGSPVVRLNRAVAVAEASGPGAGLALLEGLEQRLPRSHRLAGVRGELLLRANRADEAARSFQAALELCVNDAERTLLQQRRDAAIAAVN